MEKVGFVRSLFSDLYNVITTQSDSCTALGLRAVLLTLDLLMHHGEIIDSGDAMLVAVLRIKYGNEVVRLLRLRVLTTQIWY